MSHPNIAKEEKVKFLNEHFFYELQMLDAAFGMLIEEKQKDRYKANIALESIISHARNLIEFYYYDSKNGTKYARAKQFIHKWDNIRPNKTPSLNSVLTRGNNEVTHITYARIYGAPENKNWNLSAIYKDLIILTKLFLNNLDEDYLGNSLNNLKEELNDI